MYESRCKEGLHACDCPAGDPNENEIESDHYVPDYGEKYEDADECANCGSMFDPSISFDNFYCNSCYTDDGYPFNDEMTE
jgi:hypothetical protein